MKSFIWSESYQSMGIWGSLSCFCKIHHCESWGVMTAFNGECSYISSNGEIQDDMKFNLVDMPVTIMKGEGIHQYFIPVFLHEQIIFCWEFKTKVLIYQEEMNVLQFNLELFVLYESYNSTLYPSFLVLLYPLRGSMALTNQKIAHSKSDNIIFLNGKKGTGKYTFLQCFLLLHHNYFIQKNNLNQAVNRIRVSLPNGKYKSLFYVPELAFLDTVQQEKLLHKGIEGKEYLIIVSVYDIAVLYSNRIISKEILDLCTSNHLLFPSLSKRNEDIIKILKFTSSVKSLKYEKSVFSKNNNFEKISNYIVDNKLNLCEIKNNISQNTMNQYDKIENFDNLLIQKMKLEKRTLREIIASIEANAIRYAHAEVGNSQNKMSDLLGISRGSLQNKLKKYNLNYDTWID